MMLILMTLLLFKHCYADFVLQTYMQTVKKGVWLHPVGISHSMEHVICTMSILLLFNFVFPIAAFSIFLIGLLEGIVHYIIDFTKVKYGSKDSTSSRFWTEFGIDQFLHQLTYVAIVAYIFL